MKCLFANDTSGTSNPGCQGTVAGLMDCLEEAGLRVDYRTPFGYRYAAFGKCLVDADTAPVRFPGQGRITEAWRVLKTGKSGGQMKTGKRRVSAELWNREIDRLAAHMSPLIQECDCLVVNGEGTIHDDGVGALALVGMCVAAKRLGKQVRLLNASVFDLDPLLLKALREHVDDLAVREPISQRYLEIQGIKSRLSADCLFLAKEKSHSLVRSGWERTKRSRVIYTPGVLAGSGKIAAEAVGRDISALISEGHEVLYYVVELEDERLAGAAHAAGARIIPLGAFDWREVIPLLQTADFVVSGRYHINIFAILAGIPFVPMETNTKKMHGLLELIEASIDANPGSWACGMLEQSKILSRGVTVSSQNLSYCLQLARHSAVK